MEKQIKLVILLILCLPVYLHGVYSGTRVFEFLKIDTTARPSAMGGTFVGIADDVNAINYNPAGLGLLDNNQVVFMHNQWFQEIKQEYLAFSHSSGLGIALNYFNYGTIKETTISNPRGTGLDDFSNYDGAADLGYGSKINDKLAIGFNLRYIQGKISDYKGWAVSSNLGCLYVTPIEKLTMGVVIQNISTKVKFIDTKEELPLIFKIGFGYKLLNDKLTAGFDLGQQIDNEKILFNIGAEYLPIKFLALRSGINTRNETDTGITAGIGFNYSSCNLDYAYSPYGDLGDTHKIALTYRFGENKEKAVEVKKVESPLEALKKVEGIEVKEEKATNSEVDNTASNETEKNTKIIVPEKAIQFALNSDVIENYETLDKIIGAVLQIPVYEIKVIGHADSIGKKQYNLDLSQRRAENVMKYIIIKGINKGKISAIGVGDTHPVLPNLTPTEQFKNRRVEIIVH